MALKVNWSPLAQQKRKEILAFWKEHNGNNSYSRELNNLFIQATKQLSRFPQIGRLTDIEGIRVKIIRDYLLFYEVKDATIEILTVWDSRQDPDQLKIRS